MVSPRYTVPSPHVEPALDLVCKYIVPGPRYTACPTALQFTEIGRLVATLQKISKFFAG